MLFGVRGTPVKVTCEFGRNHSATRIIKFSFYYLDGISVHFDEEFPE
jgi:hypothetical protein